MRLRAYPAEISKVADGDPANSFIYATVRIGQGRSEAVKKAIGDRLFAVIQNGTQELFASNQPISLGLEIQEIEKDWTWKKNNIHQILKEKHA